MFPSRGATLGIFLLCATVARGQTATGVAVGIVVDSIRGHPLAGATIGISDAPKQGLTDSAGRFRVDSIPPGDHVITVFDSWLDAIGVSLTTNRITFGPGATVGVLLATPSGTTWVAHHCSDADRQQGASAIVGRVLQLTGDDPAPVALVRYSANIYEASKDIGVRHTTITREASTAPTGDFVICGIPAGTTGAVQATRGRAGTGQIPADLSAQTVLPLTLRLAADDTLAHHTGVVTGKVVDDHGAPISGVRVLVRGSQSMTQTSDSGTFALRDLSLGSQAIDLSKVGLPRVDTTVTVLATQAVTLTLRRSSSDAQAKLATVGFVRRRQAGVGIFITADTIAARKARYIADLLPLMPELQSVPTTRGPVLVPANTIVRHCFGYMVDGDVSRFMAAGQIRGNAQALQAAMVEAAGRINEDVPAAKIVGLEYYRTGEMPQDLLTMLHGVVDSRCSMIAIWTDAAAQ